MHYPLTMQIDLFNYDYSLKYQPLKNNKHDCWHLSLLSEEEKISFKAKRKENAWYHDHGRCENLIVFAVEVFSRNTKEALKIFLLLASKKIRYRRPK
jgi:hypothetical protein